MRGGMPGNNGPGLAQGDIVRDLSSELRLSMGEVETLFLLTWGLQLLHKLRRTWIVAHVHNKHLTMPGHNHHFIMIVNCMSNTVDNIAVASETI